MITTRLRDKIIDSCLQLIPQCTAIYLFGSVGTKYEKHNSDIDLAILTDKPLNHLERWDIQQQLATQLHREVDLIDLRSTTTVLAHQIIQEGQCIFNSDSLSTGLFETTTDSLYLKLNEERADILKDFHHYFSGKPYE